jgi:hypothetical protein
VLSCFVEVLCVPLTFSFGSSKTLQTSQVSIVSRFGWGLTKKIEDHGLAKFQANIRKVQPLPLPLRSAPLTDPFTQSREGLFTVLHLLRQQPMALGLSGSLSDASASSFTTRSSHPHEERREAGQDVPESAAPRATRWGKLRSWFRA